MTLFRLDASIQRDGSRSRQLADLVQHEWEAAYGGERVISREIGIDPLPSDAWATAVMAGATPAEQRTVEQSEATALASTLVDELTAADALLIAVPLYNYGVSQHFKTWVDLVTADPRMAAGATPATAGTPAVLATVRGGNYSAGTPREGWDHATPWIRRILEDVWQLDLLVVEADFTLVGVNPALDEFTEIAKDLRLAADDRATEHGQTLVERVKAGAIKS
jgi:FMN-dependent NADH-azoreductase